jgi:glycosyltransferase involved in cell wall biosynthesis
MTTVADPFELVLLVNDLTGGTYGNQANRLALGLAKDPRCHTTLLGYGGDRVPWLPDSVVTEHLPARRALATGNALVHYLLDRQPEVLMTRMVHMNLIAVVAAKVARARGWRGRLVLGHDHPIELSHRENKRDSAHGARLLYPRADLIAAVSPTVADDAVTGCRVPIDRVVQLPNVIDDCTPAPPPDHPWLTDGKPVFLSVARLVLYKRFDLIIDALQDLSADARLLIIGRGVAHDAIEAHVRARGMQDRVQLLGFVDDPRHFMQHATGFVLASEEEGFSQVLIEAMSTGCPVISTDSAGGGPRFVTDNGRYGALVPCGDRAGLAAAMEELLDPARRATLADRGRERAVAFTPEACARRFVDELVRRGFDQHRPARARGRAQAPSAA